MNIYDEYLNFKNRLDYDKHESKIVNPFCADSKYVMYGALIKEANILNVFLSLKYDQSNMDDYIDSIFNDESELNTNLNDETNINTNLNDETNINTNLNDETNINTNLNDETNINSNLNDETNINSNSNDETDLDSNLNDNSSTSFNNSELISDIDKKYYDINYNFLTKFPTDYVLQFLDIYFNTRHICHIEYVNIEIVKFIYHNWNQPFIADFINELKKHLIELVNMTRDEYYDILRNSNNKKYNREKHYIYYTWWLYAFYPLIENAQELILKLIDLVYLDDAQDMLLYGIYQINNINELYLLIKNILFKLNTQDKPCFYMFESGTGALFQFKMILNKLDIRGKELLLCPELKDVFMFTNFQGKLIDVRDKFNLYKFCE